MKLNDNNGPLSLINCYRLGAVPKFVGLLGGSWVVIAVVSARIGITSKSSSCKSVAT